MWKSLPIALCLPLVSGCLTGPSRPLVQIPANLSAPCQAIPARPDPLIDPDRLAWEIELIFAYRECAAKHAATVRASSDALP